MIRELSPEEQAAGTPAKNDYAELVNLLAVLSEAHNQMDELQSLVNSELLETVDGHKGDYAKLQDIISKSDAALEVIARRHPEWFKDGKTIKTPYGSVSLKNNPPKLEVKNEELTLMLIEKAGAEAVEKFTRQRTELNLEALGGLDDAALKQFRITRTSGDRFEAKPAKVDLGKAVKAAEKKEKG